MNTDYALVGRTLESTGKEIIKANRKLDKVLEEHLQFEDLSSRKEAVIELLNKDKIADALTALTSLDKDSTKAKALQAKEDELRQEIKALMAKAEKTAKGEVDSEEPAKLEVVKPEADSKSDAA